MFSPAVLYILLLVAGPFFLAIFYAFSDARIGNTEMHYVGVENFRSILKSPSFRIAIRNSFIFTICSQNRRHRRRQYSSYRFGEDLPRARLHPFLDPSSMGGADRAGSHRMEMDSGLHLQRHQLGARGAPLLQALQRSHVAG